MRLEGDDDVLEEDGGEGEDEDEGKTVDAFIHK